MEVAPGGSCPPGVVCYEVGGPAAAYPPGSPSGPQGSAYQPPPPGWVGTAYQPPPGWEPPAGWEAPAEWSGGTPPPGWQAPAGWEPPAGWLVSTPQAPPNIQGPFPAGGKKRKSKKLLRDPEVIKEEAEELSEWLTGEILKTSAYESSAANTQISETAKAAASEIYPVVVHIVNDTVNHLEAESQSKQDNLKVEQELRFKVTKAMAEGKLQAFEVLINKTTSEAARKSRSRTLANQVRNTTERANIAINQLHEAEDAMVHTAKSAVESSHLAAKQWKKTILQRHAGQDYAVAARYESRESTYEAEVAVQQVSTSLDSTQRTSQHADRAFNKAHISDVEAKKVRAFTVGLFKQINATTKGIVTQQIETQNAVEAANHALEVAANATSLALKASLTIQKLIPDKTEEAAAPASTDSEDAE